MESHEAHVPGITFFISNKSGDLSWRLDHGTNLELPDTAVDIGEAIERSPVLKHLGLSGWHRHHADVGHKVAIVKVVVKELGLVYGVEDVKEFALLPYSVGTKNVILLVFAPFDVSHREVVVLGHFEGSGATAFLCSSGLVGLIHFLVEAVNHAVVNATHLNTYFLLIININYLL